MRAGQHNIATDRDSVHHDFLWLPELCAGADDKHRRGAA
jgi:hypothetical protein